MSIQRVYSSSRRRTSGMSRVGRRWLMTKGDDMAHANAPARRGTDPAPTGRPRRRRGRNAPAGAGNRADRVLVSHSGPIRSPAHHRIVGIDQGDDAARHRDRLAAQSAGIARAVPSLVVGVDDLLGDGEDFIVVDAGQRLGPEQALVAETRVPAHFLELRRREGARLAQYRVADAHLADVMKRRQRGDEGDAAGVQRPAIRRAPGQRGREDPGQFLVRRAWRPVSASRVSVSVVSAWTIRR